VLGWLPGALTLIAARGGLAQTGSPHFQMTWEVPADCLPQAPARRKLAVLLGREPEDVASAPIEVHAAIARTGEEAWRVELAITQHGERRLRRLTASSCEELGDAVALLVALAIDPDMRTRLGAAPPDEPYAREGQQPPAAASLPAPAGSPAPLPARAEPMARPAMPYASFTGSTRRLRWDGFFGVGPVVEAGVLPHPGFGVSLAAGVDVERLRLELGARYVTSARTDQGVYLHLEAVALRVCWLVPLGRDARLGPCAVGELGQLRADGSRAGAGSDSADWGAARAGAHIEARPLHPLHLALQADAGLPFGRPTFIVRGEQDHRPASVVAGARILLEVHIP
jgi:hypothetical protein